MRELLVAFPLYRTYGTEAEMPPEGQEMLRQVVQKVYDGPHAPDANSVAFLERILLGKIQEAARAKADEFRIRFQQLTGPLMAKSVEDTLFFRQHMLLALNEVGSDPLPRVFSLDRFHDEMQTRLTRQPDGLSGTSTHDTKRGEDARGRLYTISEAPDVWAGHVARWREMNAASVRALEDGPAPEPAVEWMLYQALAGVWPTELLPDDPQGLEALEKRFIAFVEKALREAKLRTNWSNSNETYEDAVISYAKRLLSPSNSDFLADFHGALRPFVRAGLVNSLTQTIIKLTAPGVPDIYQGSEGLDFSLVDPDNRREPAFADLHKRLAQSGKLSSSDEEAAWQTGSLKQQVIAEVLHLRQELPTLFREGNYVPLDVSGKRSSNIVAFARQDDDDALLVVVPRLVVNALHTTSGQPRTERWAETEVVLTDGLRDRRYRDIFTGKTFDPKDRIAVNWIFADHPFTLLLAQ